VCVLRIETRGADGVLITVTTTPDVTVTSSGRAKTVANADEALALVARFLRAYRDEMYTTTADLDVYPDSGHGDD